MVLIATNKQLQAEQSVMTNLAFALDTMTREIRTGYNYVCDSVPNSNAGVTGLTPTLTGQPPQIFNDTVNEHEDIGDRTKDCDTGRDPSSDNLQGLSFYEGGDSITSSSGGRRILYFYDATARTIMRRVGNDIAQSIVSSGLVVQNAEFFVTGSTPSDGGVDVEQPTVTIYIEAQDVDDPTAKSYYLQTTVTQRTLDL